jgi:hypothetical protein
MAELPKLKDGLDALAQAAKRQQQAADQAALAKAPAPEVVPAAPTIVEQRGLPTS